MPSTRSKPKSKRKNKAPEGGFIDITRLMSNARAEIDAQNERRVAEATEAARAQTLAARTFKLGPEQTHELQRVGSPREQLQVIAAYLRTGAGACSNQACHRLGLDPWRLRGSTDDAFRARAAVVLDALADRLE